MGELSAGELSLGELSCNRYYPLHYAYKTKIEKFVATFFWLKKIRTNSIYLRYLRYILCIFTVDYFFNIRP